MINGFTGHFSNRRTAAAEAVAALLRDIGFTPSGEKKWKGLTPKGHPIEVALPGGFPDEMPEVFSSDSTLGQIAHVERSGKLCVAPTSGTLLDVSRPADIVRDAIEKADGVLEAKPEEQVKEILREYESYWAEFAGKFVSICPPRSNTGECCSLELDATPPITLIAPTSGAAWDWAKATGRKPLKESTAYFIRLPRPIKPPPFGDRVALREILSLVQDIDSAETARTLKTWLARHGLPATMLLSAPLDDREDIVVAVQVPELNPKAAARAQNGFRRGKVPSQILVARAASEPVDRLDVDRADLDFIHPRGGAMNDLMSKTVTVIGCGSVGSFTAAALASSGVGHLVLVDHETLKTENFQRHLLGASNLGDAKVTGVARALKARFPHLKITEISTKVQESLDKPDSPVLRADLILCAVGEDNLELQLNELLFGRHRCMHVWLDPLGIGGHVLRTGTRGNPGCFQCLFRSDPTLGMVNMASFVAPNQKFQRTLGGCSGTFTPFGALDAERAGIEAAREAIACLNTDEPTVQLTSWVVSKTAVASGDFVLSHRGQSIAEGTLVRDASFVRADCPVCSRGPA